MHVNCILRHHESKLILLQPVMLQCFLNPRVLLQNSFKLNKTEINPPSRKKISVWNTWHLISASDNTDETQEDKKKKTLKARWPLHGTVKSIWKNERNAQQSPWQRSLLWLNSRNSSFVFTVQISSSCVYSVCLVWRCEGERGWRSRGAQRGVGREEGRGQILSCCVLVKSDEGLQQLCTSTAGFRTETCRSSHRLGGERRLCGKCVFPEEKGTGALKALCGCTCA